MMVAASGLMPLAAAASTLRTSRDPLEFVNPQLLPAWLALRRWSQEAGRLGAPAAPPGLGQLAITPDWSERRIPGRDGAPFVKIYVHGAKPGTTRPVVLHIHGGGFTGGSPAISMGTLRAIASVIDCVIVTVDYRLAPATTFPGSLEDNYAALAWVSTNAAELGADRARIALLGESAGGGHVAALAIAARDRGEFPVSFQALVYPMLDDRTGSNGAVAPAFVDAATWTFEANRQSWSALLGVPAGSDRVPPKSVPGRLEDFTGLPPTYIAVGSIDIFAGESLAFARRLIDAGIPVEMNVVPGAFHGFDIFAPQTNLTRVFLDRLVGALAAAFET